MPLVPFDQMPDDARLWVFGSQTPLDDVDAPRLLAAVDSYLAGWKAHGTPLVCARDFREDQFLAIAVDERASDASGCSIDGLFRVLQEIETGIGTSMVGGGLVFFRDHAGFVHGCTRAEFTHMGAMGEVNEATPVFDMTLTTVGEYRSGFEKPAAQGWQAKLIPARKGQARK
jgi:hypothetical protein